MAEQGGLDSAKGRAPELTGQETEWTGRSAVTELACNLPPVGLDRFANLGGLGLDGIGAPGWLQSGGKRARNG
jgi:hypothetical protein